MSGTVELVLAVVVEGLGDGRVRAAPLFERQWMTHDDEEEALESLRTFAEARLAEAAPSEVARLVACASEGEHAIRMVVASARVAEEEPTPSTFDVATVVLGPGATELARTTGPNRLARTAATGAAHDEPRTPLPAWWGTRALWIAIPILDHVMRVPDEVSSVEELDAAVTAEIARVVAAVSRDAVDVLAALPSVTTRIERLTLQVRRPERLDAETRARGERASSDALRRREKQRLLDRMGRRIEPRPRPIGRDALVAQLESFVRSDERLAVLVRGPELVGKSSLVEHVLGASDRPAYAIPVARFLAGEGALGEWQTRVEETLRAAELLDAILYVEDLGSLALERPGSPIDLAGAFAPFLESRRVRFVAEIRSAELDRFEARHRGLASTLLALRVEPMDVAATREVLAQTMGRDAQLPPPAPTATPRRRLESDAIRTLVALVERYLPYRSLPGEALRTAEALRDVLEVPRGEDGTVPPIGRAELVRALAERLGLPAALLREDLPLPPQEIAEALRRRVLGQDEAVEAVAATLGVVKAGLAAPGKPIATFLFAGPTGTGKTELARALAAYLFGTSDALARFDMSEYMDPWSGDRLIRGSDREDGLLTRRARERPFSVLLLDEIEKAHPSVFDLLLQLLGEGRLTDARGKTAFFQNTIVVMTSNLGARDERPALGFDPDERARGEVYLRAVREHFRPELLNRLDRIVPFRPLAERDVREVTRLFASAIPRRPGLSDPRHTLELDDATLALLAGHATSRDGGARALRREVEDGLVVGAARLLARLGSDAERATIGVRPATDDERSTGTRVISRGLAFELRGKRARARAHQRSPLDRVTALRRRLSRWSLLASVESSRTERARLVSELARAGHRRASAQEIAGLEQRLGWLAPRLDRAETLARDLETIEDAALAAHVADEDVAPLAAEAERVAASLELALYDVVASWLSSEEHEVTVTAVGDRRQGLERFLEPMLSPIEGVLLSLECHFPAGIGNPVSDWPDERAWGPPREPEQARTLLRTSSRFQHVYVFLGGRDAYLALCHFEGLVRIVHEGQKLGVLVQAADLGPQQKDAKLPEVVTVPTTPVLEIDLDAGYARIPGDDERYAFAGLRWTTCLARLALAAQARSEGL